MLTDDIRTIPEDIRYFLETGAGPKQLRRERVTETVSVRAFHSGYLEDWR